MRNCYQFNNLSVLGHGLSVMRKAAKLYRGEFEGFVLPDWFKDNFAQIKDSAHPWKTIKRYAIWHDVGKPYCRTVDESGKQHFPGHEEKSKQIFVDNFNQPSTIGELIGNDMLVHTVKSDELNHLLLCNKLNKSDCFTLLLVAFAELHANAEMFGGISSVGFKMKYKQLDKRGKQLVNFWKRD